MKKNYTDEVNTQILIALMKLHGIRKVVVSPGAMNVSFVGSIQFDDFFEIYSSVDERSAAYLACGLAAESGECVALSCTGATASRNYVSALTEAFYRKLPILAITSTRHIGSIGHNIPQVIDRTNPMNDIAKMSVHIPTIHDEEDKWAYEVMINKALLELKHRGGGPVHINLTTTAKPFFTEKELPKVRMIERICDIKNCPSVSGKSIAIFVGAHKKWSQELVKAVERFCELYNCVVLCDHLSNYWGKYRVSASLLMSQEQQYRASGVPLDMMIHLGDTTAYSMKVSPKQVWRVNPDGEIRDTFRKLRYVFEMQELDFFECYNELAKTVEGQNTCYDDWKVKCDAIRCKVPDLPFSNAWVAQQTISKLPNNAVLHLAILNSLRNWGFFDAPEGTLAYSNTGGFGIDGIVSTLLGASLANQDNIYFGVVGDLAFFYDMNALGNRHFGSNVRIILVNNGMGIEFKNYNHMAARFEADTDAFMAAAGHYGNQSRDLVRHYASDLGFEYLCANNKEEYLDNLEHFVTEEKLDKPILFEIFTDAQDESNALELLRNIDTSLKGSVIKMAKENLSEKSIQTISKFVKY